MNAHLGNLGDAGGAALLECKCTLCSLWWWRGVWEASIHSRVLPGQPFSLCKHPSSIVVFFVCPLSNMIEQWQLELRGIKFRWSCSGFVASYFMLLTWTSHQQVEGLPRLCKILWFVHVLIFLGTHIGFWVCKDITVTLFGQSKKD